MHHTLSSRDSGSMSRLCRLLGAALVALLALVASCAQADRALTEIVNRMKINDLFTKQIYIDDQTPVLQLESMNLQPGSQVQSKVFGVNVHKDGHTVYAEPPKFKLDQPTGVGDLLTLIMVDLDRKQANSNSTLIYNQYLVFNIHDNRISTGQAVTTYLKPTLECIKNHSHRILVIAFLQHEYIDISDVAPKHSSSVDRNLERRERVDVKFLLARYAKKIVAANAFYLLPDPGGVCSSATASSPSLLQLSAVLFLMVILSSLALRSTIKF